MNNKIVVVGSLNMDKSFACNKIPRLGETILSHEVTTTCGGKGLNQAITIGKLDGDVTMIGAVGDDEQGQQLIQILQENHVDTSGIIIKKGMNSGSAMIMVDPMGNNAIVVNPAANYALTIQDIQNHQSLLEGAGYCLLQLEIEMDVIEYVIDYCHQKGIKVILNPAPYHGRLSSELLGKVDILIPNETELIAMCQVEEERKLVDCAKQLLQYNHQVIIVTLGEKGVLVVTKQGSYRMPSLNVEVVDTTGAGDCFIGSFLESYARGNSLEKAINFANRAAALTVSKKGASVSIPSLSEIINSI